MDFVIVEETRFGHRLFLIEEENREQIVKEWQRQKNEKYPILYGFSMNVYNSMWLCTLEEFIEMPWANRSYEDLDKFRFNQGTTS